MSEIIHYQPTFRSSVGEFRILPDNAVVQGGNKYHIVLNSSAGVTRYSSVEDAKIAIKKQKTGFAAWDELPPALAENETSHLPAWTEKRVTVIDKCGLGGF